jgi:hypothetical protein
VRSAYFGLLGVIALIVGASVAEPLSAQTSSNPSTTVDQTTKAAAEKAALNFVTRFEEGDPGVVYDEELSATFKALQSRQLFVQQAGFLKVQSGGSALARELIGSQPFSQTPSGQTGEYCYVRFRTRHPNGLVFQDVYLEKVGTEWKVGGFFTMAAPQQ